MQKPRLKPHLTVFSITSQEWGIRGGLDELVRIRPKSEEAVLAMRSLWPLLAGGHAVDVILAALEQQGIRPTVTSSLLVHLEALSLLEDAGAALPDSGSQPHLQRQLSYFGRFSADGGHSLQDKLTQSRVGLICGQGLGSIMLRQLRDSGIGHIVAFADEPEWVGSIQASGALAGQVSAHPLDRNTIWPEHLGIPLPQIFVVALDTHDPALFDAIERLSFDQSIPWCLVQVTSTREATVGPLFVPRESACYSCMEGRVLSNLRYPREHLALRNQLDEAERPSAPVGGLIAYYELIAGIAVVEIIKFLTGVGIPQLVGRMLAVDTSTWTSEIHDVLRLPQCRCRLEQPTYFPWKEANYAKRQGSRS